MSAATPTTALEIPVESLETTRDPIIETAVAIIVTDDATNAAAGKFLVEVLAPLEKQIRASADPVCAATNTAHKAATKQRADLLLPVLHAEKVVKAQIGNYQVMQQRLIDEENARIEREHQAALRKAEDERLAAEKVEREAAEAARKKIEDAQIEKAAALEAQGKHDEAERVAAEEIVTRATQPAYIPPVEPALPPRIARPAPAKVAGVSTRMKTVVEVVNLEALVRAICAGGPKVPGFAVLTHVQAKLLAFVNSHDGKITLPGCRITQEPLVSKRGR